MPVFLRSKMAAGWTQTVLTMDEKRSTRTRSKAAEDSRRDAFTSVIYTVVFLMSNIALRIGTAWYVRKTKLHLFFAWMQSCFVLILMWKRRRPFSLNSFKSSPGIYFYTMFVIISETCCNKLTANGSGSEVIQFGLATSPLFLVLGTMWYNRKTQPSLVMAFVVMISLVMMVTVSSINEQYFPFKFTIFNGSMGLLHGCVTALMILSFQTQFMDDEVNIVQQVYTVNLVSIVVFPVAMLVTGEVHHFLDKGLTQSWFYIVIIVFLLAILRVMDQSSCLYQIKHTSGLAHNATRGLAWIPISLISVFTLKLELMIPSFVCFWLHIVVFLAVMFDHVTS